MLGSIRKFSTSIYAKILLGIVVIPFVFWGMGSSFRSGSSNVIVVIDKEKFSTEEFGNFINSYQVGKKINSEKIDELLSIFIGNKLIKNEYDRYDIKLSDKSLSKLIKIQKEFKKDNKFSRSKYEKFLITNNLDAVSFENNLSNQEKRKQLLSIIGGGIVPSKYMVNDVYNKINQKRKIELININDVIEKEVIYSEDKIKTYYESNKKKYIEIYKSVKILEINPKNLIGIDEFNSVFFKMLDEIHDLLIQGEKLDLLINKYNLSKPNVIKINKLGQDLNYKKIDKISKEIISNIFSMTNESPIALVETNDKYYIVEIFKTENIQKKIDNENVIVDIKANLQYLEIRRLMTQIVAKINQKKFLKIDFDNFSKNQNVSIQKITLDNLNDAKTLDDHVVSKIYTFPEKEVNLIFNAELTENFLVYIDEVMNASIDENSDEYEKYFNLSKISITSGLFNTYDKYLKEKYKIDINYKALKTIKDYFN